MAVEALEGIMALLLIEALENKTLRLPQMHCADARRLLKSRREV